jgi:outer membrane lipoprotein-sorting protein
MNTPKNWKSLLFAASLSLLTGSVAAQDARQIMEKMDEQQRKVLDQTLTLSVLSSCKFGTSGKQAACIEEPRIKKMESVSRQLGEHKKDSQNISILLEPASERGIGMLTYTWDDATRDTESWLYLSALGKVKRMASGAGEDQEPVSLFGSEFTTEDMETGKTDEYDYKILQEGPYQERPVWVIEALPKPVRLQKTRYSKLLIWVDKERYVALKMQNYDKRGDLFKRMLFSRFEQHNQLWRAREITLFNMKAQRLSTITTEKIAMGIEIDPEFLTERTLSDFAWREQVLQKLRQSFR